MNKLYLLIPVLFITSTLFGQSNLSQDYPSFVLNRNCIELDASQSVQEERIDLIYKWNFGDDTEQYGKLVAHCYDSKGTYPIILSVIDPITSGLHRNEWKFDVEIKDDFDLLFKIIESNTNTVTLSPSVNSIMEDFETIYFWDYGDGKFGIDSLHNHIYDEPGSYTIRLLAEITVPGEEPFNLSNTQQITIQ